MAEDFDQLARSIVLSVLSAFPQWGTLSGLHEHDDELPEVGPDVVADRWNEFRRVAEPLLQADPVKLEPAERIDRAVVQHALDYMEFTLLHVEQWKKDPDVLREIGRALCVQLWRDYAPFEERVDQLAGRLDKLPDYLEAVREQILDPVPLWTELAMATTGEMPAFFQTIAAATEHMVSPGVQDRLERAVDRAARATDEYYAWLVQDVQPHATAQWVIGAEAMAELCRVRQLGMTPADLTALGQDLLTRGREELRALADEVRPGRSVGNALAVAYAEYPRTIQAALDEFGHAMRNAHRFLYKKKLVPLPDDDELELYETPAFLRQLYPVTGYIPPGRFEEEQHGTWFVTPASADQQMQQMLSASTIWNTVVRDSYPGRHLMAVEANLHAPLLRILPGFVGGATETLEGWALYCQHVMADEGFLKTSQRRLIQMRDHCLCGARLLADVGLHTGAMSVDEAVDLLAREGHVAPEVARADVRAGTLHPGKMLSPLLGAYELMRMREDMETKLGDAFKLHDFHAAVMHAGPIPLRLVRESLAEALPRGAAI